MSRIKYDVTDNTRKQYEQDLSHRAQRAELAVSRQQMLNSSLGAIGERNAPTPRPVQATQDKGYGRTQ